ncbi:EF-hand domain-containing protein [Sphingomonas hankookensis]|uniref:EF-hand domain-containing protein n=1 Tax=Sphingomonas hankookensis TaxID=563996 RepID=UPI003D301ED1
MRCNVARDVTGERGDVAILGGRGVCTGAGRRRPVPVPERRRDRKAAAPAGRDSGSRAGRGRRSGRSPAATPRTREQKRFDRYDKDRDGRITRDEYLASRRKAYAKLDTNGDGRLSFDEWAARTTTKFATADKGRDGALDAAEFATTAVKHAPRKRVACPPATAPADEG